MIKSIKKYFPDLLLQMGVLFISYAIFLSCGNLISKEIVSNVLPKLPSLGGHSYCDRGYLGFFGIIFISVAINIFIRRIINGSSATAD